MHYYGGLNIHGTLYIETHVREKSVQEKIFVYKTVIILLY